MAITVVLESGVRGPIHWGYSRTQCKRLPCPRSQPRWFTPELCLLSLHLSKHTQCCNTGQGVWKSICLSVRVKCTLKDTHIEPGKRAHAPTHNAFTLICLCFAWLTGVHAKAGGSNFKDWVICSGRKLLLQLSTVGVTPEMWVAEGCHDLEGKGVGGKRQDKRGTNRFGCGVDGLAPIIKSADIMAQNGKRLDVAGEVWGIDLHGLCVFATTLDGTVI